MFRLADGSLVLAATDLTNHLACPHLTQQRLAIARRERAKARPADDPHAELVRIRGDVHEREQLRLLSAECGGHVDLSTDTSPYTREDLDAAANATADAMRAGRLPAPILAERLGIHQARAAQWARAAGATYSGYVELRA